MCLSKAKGIVIKMIDNNPKFYIEDDKLLHFAENTAKMLELSGSRSAKGAEINTAENLKRIRSVVRASEEYAAAGNRMPKPAEWLTDNWYIAEREGKQAMRDLKNISKTRMADKKGKSIVTYAAEELASSGAGKVTAERMSIFLEGFQNVVVLRERELSVFMPSLKVALVSKLADISARTDEYLKRNAKLKSGVACQLPGTEKMKTDEECDLAEEAERVITSLRLLSSIDVFKILESANMIERILQNDPSGVYPQMDDKTRMYYRRRVSELSRKTEVEEYKLAQKIVSLASSGEGKYAHVGYYLFERPLGNIKKTRTGSVYVTTVMLSSAFLALLLGFLLKSPIISIILLFPISEIIKNFQDFLIIKFVRPRLMPKLELKSGIPEEGRTICVISALLTSEDAADECAERLEEYYLSNRDSGKNLLFGVLADLPESKTQQSEGDAAKLSKLQKELERLNEKYCGFFLFTRGRTFSECNGRYMGWERKRGALLELVRLLSGEKTKMRIVVGEKSELRDTRYIITLDSDTRLGVSTARELVGAMLHPLNKAEVDSQRRVVTAGHGILQPRVSVDLKAANRSDFTRLFAGQGGIDPYGNTAGDVYHDIFEEGSFMGKGIIDVEAYYACLNNRFPENLILSHDLLEGAYLRAGFAGDVEFTDGYPYKISSYYERLHRWTRGDWQLVRWLRAYVPDENGKPVKNPLNQVNRWKIFDNLRRSTVPIFTFAAVYIGMLTSSKDFAVAGSVAILSAISALLISSAELVLRRDISSKARYHSTIISGFGAALTRTLLQLLFLPYQAYICFHAIVTALYRMYVSKKNLLSWVTAAESEKKKCDNLLAYFRKMYAAMLLGVLAILFSKWVAGAAVGALWLISPICALSLSVERNSKRNLSVEDRLFIVRAANDIWRYFCELTGPDNNYLPPDNYQEQPYVGSAERTSPTNIGLALLSAQAAMDLNLSGCDSAPALIENILETIEKLPKWKGHLYNWYDSKTLSPLDPPYISTVDSGNLAGALIVLREALLERGEEFKSLAERADKICDAMDFTLLFDDERQLFYIGLEADGKPTKGWYDLMASEARQTSYLAIAKGQVAKKHWRRLGRALVSKDNFSGMASWTGTMFEYLMPNLIMPCYENSLLYESMKFCIFVQQKAFSPWGMSESAFYSFDPNLNYQYKAHGAPRLALKRGQDKDCVISPYSTFLAMQLSLRNSVKNLKKLAQMGMEGRYGYYEAADFTPARQLGKKFEVVRCFMAHHLGMSIIAADNAVNDGIMQKRFMRDREMAAYSELLQEKVPVGQIVLKKSSREVPDKPRMITWQGLNISGEGVGKDDPACTLLSNGAYTVALSETGASRSMFSDTMVTRFDGTYFGASQGMSFYIKTESGIYSLLPAPDFSGEPQFSYKFTDRFGEIYAKRQDFSSCVNVRVSPNQNGELRTVIIKNTQNKTMEAELVCYFEPVLAKRNDYYAHPAFSKLGIETEIRDGVIVIKRRSNGKKRSAFAAFACDSEMRFDTMKEAALGRGGERSLKNALRRPAGNTLGAVLDPCILARVKVQLKPSEEGQYRFALCAEDNADEAALAASGILKLPAAIAANRVEEAAKSLCSDASDIATVMELLKTMVFKRENYKDSAKQSSATGAKEALWKMGISGDIPIITVVADKEDCSEKARKLLKSHMILRRSGIKSDLVFVTSEGGDYRRPVKTMLSGVFRELCLESEGGNGIYVVDIGNLGELLLASSKVIYCSEKSEKKYSLPEAPPEHRFWKEEVKSTESIVQSYGDGGSFVFETGGSLPVVSWSNILTNGSFGYISSDCGTGHMWYKNARENKVNVWKNDLLATDGTERISVFSGGKAYSVFADADGLNCRIRFGFGFTEWEKEINGAKIRTTAFVPPDSDVRILIIRAEGLEIEKINYFTDIVLGADFVQNGTKISVQDGLVIAENKGNLEFPDIRFITAFSENLIDFKDTSAMSRTLSCVLADFKLNKAAIIVSGCDDEEKIKAYLDPQRAEDALEQTKKYWLHKLGVISVQTPDENLNKYMSGWALYQSLASRVLGRTSMYQNGGAYGFRDQLQDVSCIAQHFPELAKEQILRAAEHQYVEGDVQHWWHPNLLPDQCDKGVRTRCSDDLLWLPYSLSRYCRVTGDMKFCDTKVEYIASPVLKAGEAERYELPSRSGVFDSVFDHAKRALDMVISRGTGEHGLKLIGSGDWNDGFDRLGIGGKGESVWLSWFAAHVLERFAEICTTLGNDELARHYEKTAETYASAANRAWDGKWFKRAYFDDGKPLGAHGDSECEIDSIAQSFSTWTKYSEREKSALGIKSAVDRLYDRQNGIVKLFTPPFQGESTDPGYIRGYVPGVRENGGQYTHAAVWLAMGCLKTGMNNEGWEILRTLLPAGHKQSIYKAEPFVLAADVYSNPQHVGRGGWNWYTGAAAWYFRTVEEELLGLKLRGGKLKIEPSLPDSWDGFSAIWRGNDAEFNITVKKTGKKSVTVDGENNPEEEINLYHLKGKHDIFVDIDK